MRQIDATAGLVLSLCVVCSACTIAPSAQEIGTADYGTFKSEERLHEICLAWLKTKLPNPDSIRVQWGHIGPAWTTGYLTGEPGVFPGNVYGYGIRASVQFKNSIGLLVKPRRYSIFTRDGKVLWGDWPDNQRIMQFIEPFEIYTPIGSKTEK